LSPSPRRRQRFEVTDRFVVFISSAQQEFETFRKELKQTLDTERWANLLVMRGRLIENQRGHVVEAEIRRALDDSSVYVGIFGRRLRDWPVREFRYAKACGLPQLVYKYERGTRRRPSRGRISDVDRFLEREVKGNGIRLRGPYSSLERLPEIIMADLVILGVEMVRENADIRKRLCAGMP